MNIIYHLRQVTGNLFLQNPNNEGGKQPDILYVNPVILTYLHFLFTKLFTNNNYLFKGKPLNRNQTGKSTINKL